MKMKSLAYSLILATALGLVGWATPYQPDDDLGGYNQLMGGYSEKRVDQNTYIVSFNATRQTPPQTVMNYLLARCAQLTTDAGFDYFIVVSTSASNQDVNVNTRRDFHNYILQKPSARPAEYQSVEFESATVTKSQFPAQPPANPNCCGVHAATAVIKMFQGPVPRGVPRAYDAKNTAAHLLPNTF